jgi:PAS domain-containing protein
LILHVNNSIAQLAPTGLPLGVAVYLATDAMFAAPNLPKLSRNWPLVAIAGAAGFALGIALFALCGASWIVAVLTQTSALVGALVIGVPFGLAAAAIAGLFVNNRRRKQTRLFRAALNHMTQGLCMFDGAARLVLCNQVYIDMYHLRPEHARPGTPLRDLLMHRLTAGNFHGDPGHYVADCLRRRRKIEPTLGRLNLRTAASSRWSAGRCAAAAGSPRIATSPSSSPPRRSATRCVSVRSGGAPSMLRSARSARASKMFSKP